MKGDIATLASPEQVLTGRQSILHDLNSNRELIFEFTKAFYRSPNTFRSTNVFGFSACKMPTDLWVIGELMHQFRPRTVIETGTAQGGSALWYATLMDALQIKGGQVITVDPEATKYGPRPVHPRIRYILGNSTDPKVAARVKALARQPVLVDLDADHHAAHVAKELRLYTPLIPPGGWLIVEDTNGAPVDKDRLGREIQVDGPMVAVEAFQKKHPGVWNRELACERFWLTMNPGGWLQRSGTPPPKPKAPRGRR